MTYTWKGEERTGAGLPVQSQDQVTAHAAGYLTEDEYLRMWRQVWELRAQRRQEERKDR